MLSELLAPKRFSPSSFLAEAWANRDFGFILEHGNVSTAAVLIA